ncbi:hypothetical protein Tco_0487124 [Tanacetum coccineum]
MGLWYPKDSAYETNKTSIFRLDHAGCLDTRKSIWRDTFLVIKLVSWMSKKTKLTAMSLQQRHSTWRFCKLCSSNWMRTQLHDSGFNYNKIPLYCRLSVSQQSQSNPVQHSRTKHNHTRLSLHKGTEDRFKYLVRRIGDNQNALWIWPKLRNSRAIYVYQSDGGLKRVGKSLHKMLKDGIDTWAPKQPIERVIVDYPSMYEEIQVDLFQRRAIRYTLMRIIEFGLSEHKAVWILYVTPLPQLEYTEMCFTAAKHKWIPSDRHKPPRTSYVGYQICTTELEDNLFDKAKARWVAMEQGIPEMKLWKKAKGWEKGEERMLRFHLLEFTEALEESCLSVLPHILCSGSGLGRRGDKMPKATTTDISLTKSYIPKVSKITGISPTISQFYKPIENRNIHEGRVVDQAYYKSNNIERLFTKIYSCTDLPSPDDIRRLLELERVMQWKELVRENVFGLGGHRDHLPACLDHILYCVVAKEQYNLAYFFVKRIQCARYTPTANLPYDMFLTRLYRHVMETYPHLDNGIYDIVDRVMRPLALKQTRRPRSDRGKARHSVSSSSSHHQGTSSHQHDDDDDDDNVETSRASTPSPTTYLNSLDPLNYQNYQMPSASEQTDETLFERQTVLLNQTQQMHKEMRGGFKSFGKALKGVFGKKKK